jgi:hypothetical protein
VALLTKVESRPRELGSDFYTRWTKDKENEFGIVLGDTAFELNTREALNVLGCLARNALLDSGSLLKHGKPAHLSPQLLRALADKLEAETA